MDPTVKFLVIVALWASLGALIGVPATAGADRFKDCADCPEMIALPGGDVLMGSPQDEARRADHEPNHD